jgi:hypothetical protein
VIEELPKVNISGRALELTESAISLFHKYRKTEEDDQTFKEDILPTLSTFLKDRLGRRNESFEAKLYPIISTLVEAQGKVEFDNDLIFDLVKAEMDARDVPDKEEAVFYVKEPVGMYVSRNKILQALRDKFGTDPVMIPLQDGSGTRKRGHRIPKEALERVKASYEDEYDIKILEDMSARVARAARVLDEDMHENSTPDQASDDTQDPEADENSQENTT